MNLGLDVHILAIHDCIASTAGHRSGHEANVHLEAKQKYDKSDPSTSLSHWNVQAKTKRNNNVDPLCAGRIFAFCVFPEVPPAWLSRNPRTPPAECGNIVDEYL